MTKKILLGLFILLMSAAGIIAYNFYKNTKQPANHNPILAIPQSAALILQEKNFESVYNKLSSTNIIWEELIQNTSVAKEVNLKISYLDSIFRLASLKDISQKSILTSLHLSGANDYDFVFYLPIHASISEDHLINSIKSLTSKNIEKRTYHEVTIFNITDHNKKKISFIYYKNTLSLSYSNVLIEDVIDQLNTNSSLMSNPSFSKVYRTSGEAMDGNLFINNSYFPKIIGQYLNQSSKDNTQRLENYSEWTELDVLIKSNSIMMNGFTYSPDSSDNFLTLFANQKPQNLTINSIVPNNTAFLYYYGISDSKKFFSDKNKNGGYQNFIDNQTSNFGIDLEEELLSIIGNEIAYIITEPLKESYKENQFVVLQTNNALQAKKNLLKLCAKLNAENYSEIEFKTHSIQQLDLDSSTFKQLLGSPFPILVSPFYTIINDYIIVGNSELAIKNFINKYLAERTLAKNENFQSFNENFSSKANIFIYNNIARSVNLYKKIVAEPFLTAIDEKIDLYRKFEAIAFQVNSDKNNFYYNNVYLKYNPVYKQETRTLWETRLDTTTTSKPQIVTNHKTNAKEIFIQDVANKIYLISNTGKILWSKQLSEKIMGEVHQIDVFKNNKLQLLFNTKSKLYLLDRNGENVTAFPVKLEAAATNSVTPMDYTNSKNYRILIGCSDNKVYNYNTDGDRVAGWDYRSTENTANSKIWHFTLSGKDYIIVPLQNGAIKIIQRNGKDRLQLNNKLPITDQPIYLIKGNQLSTTYLLTADTAGLVTKVYMDNHMETIKVKISKSNNFNFFNLNNDRTSDFIFSSDSILKVISGDNTTLFEKRFDQQITQFPLDFKMLDKTRRVGIIAENEIFLINEKGIIDDDFPLAGSTPFSMGDINNDKVLNLVVGDKNMVYTYNLK